ncbi:M28 family metallopeptidase [soil metagenome]
MMVRMRALSAVAGAALFTAALIPSAATAQGKRRTVSPASDVAPAADPSAAGRGGRRAPLAEVAAPLDRTLIANAEALRDSALKDNDAYSILESLTTEFGPRPAGSDNQHRAALWAAGKMKTLGFDNVRIESFPVTQWERGEETAQVLSPYPQRLVLAALGGSVATPPQGIDGEIVVCKTFEELLAQTPGSLNGRIVVVTQPMARTGDGSGYGAAYRIRALGASEAAKRGASAYLIRSLATDTRRLPHTGSMTYDAQYPRIPAAALSAPDAEQLERMVARGKPVRIRLVLTPTVRQSTSDTVIGEIRGSSSPSEIVLIGGHLDSWDLGTGAIDDGAGVAVTMAAAALIKDMPTRPKRTIRVALWGAEEIGVSGVAYAAAHGAAEQARHVIASECDLGADRVYAVNLPKGAANSAFGRGLGRVLAPLRAFISPEPATDGGSDLEELKGVPLAALKQDATRYFELHHTPDDTLDKVDPVQLNQNVAAWAAFTYLAADSGVNFRVLAAPETAPAAAPKPYTDAKPPAATTRSPGASPLADPASPR